MKKMLNFFVVCCLGFGTPLMGKAQDKNAPPAGQGGNRLLILGTAAGCAESARFVASGGSVGHADSEALLNGELLIDCSTTALTALKRSRVDVAKIRYLFLTHTHEDHFDPQEIGRLAQLTEKPLEIFADPPALKKLKGRIVPHPVKPGETVRAGAWNVLVLPANHGLYEEGEQALHYLFHNSTGSMLYALDGAWIMTKAKELLEKHKIDLVVWDATSADPDDWRSFEHNTLDMVCQLRRILTKMGVLTPQSCCLLSHRARRLWPQGTRPAEAMGFLCARDNTEYFFGNENKTSESREKRVNPQRKI